MRFVVIFVCLMGALFGGTAEERRDFVHYGVEGVIDSVDPTAFVGVKVVSLDDGTVLYERNGRRRFVPASSLKLFTMGAALDVLGAEDRFETRVMTDGRVSNGVLLGDCYLVGSGDPSLTGLDLLELVDGMEVREIRGDLVLDLSCFEDGAKGPGWMWDEEPAFWCVPMSPLNVEHNFVHGEVMERPERLVASLFKGLLDRKGVVLKGQLKLGSVPKECVCLSRHVSEPLGELIKVALQDSDNLYANCIFKRMGGSWEKGREKVEGFLMEVVGIDCEELRVVDGSGESRYNLVSPGQMVKFLREMRSNRALRSALAVGGEVGTLKWRSRGIEGKTGSMTGVSSLCGYVTTKGGEELAVAIFVNGYMKEGKEIKERLEDGICLVLTQLDVLE